MGPSGHIGYILHILDRLGQVYAGLYKFCIWVELPVQRRLPNFREKCRVTRHSRVFRGLTGSQRTPGFWGVTPAPWSRYVSLLFFFFIFFLSFFLFIFCSVADRDCRKRVWFFILFFFNTNHNDIV